MGGGTRVAGDVRSSGGKMAGRWGFPPVCGGSRVGVSRIVGTARILLEMENLGWNLQFRFASGDFSGSFSIDDFKTVFYYRSFVLITLRRLCPIRTYHRSFSHL